MHQLVTLTTFLRQHSLTCRRVCRDTRYAGIERIALRPGGCAIAAFRDGCPDHVLMKLFIILTTLFSDYPHTFA
jgi:hypothetical protein